MVVGVHLLLAMQPRMELRAGGQDGQQEHQRYAPRRYQAENRFGCALAGHQWEAVP
jgi:hypothetical protein